MGTEFSRSTGDRGEEPGLELILFSRDQKYAAFADVRGHSVEGKRDRQDHPGWRDFRLGSLAWGFCPFMTAFDFSYGFPTINSFATIGAFEKVQVRNSVFASPKCAGYTPPDFRDPSATASRA